MNNTEARSLLAKEGVLVDPSDRRTYMEIALGLGLGMQTMVSVEIIVEPEQAPEMHIPQSEVI